MKIAVIGAKNIPATKGDIERYCQEFYPRIAERGHQVDLFVQPESKSQSWFSVNYYRDLRIITLPYLGHQNLSFVLNSALSTVWASLKNYDIIHIQGTKAAWFSWFSQIFSSSKIVVTSHKLDLESQNSSKTFRWLTSCLEGMAVRHADRTIVTSKPLKEYFQNKYQVCPRYIPNAPICQQKKEQKFNYIKSLGLSAKGYILCLGSLSPHNRGDLLIKAFQKLKPLGWKLVLAGGIGKSLNYAVELLTLAKDNQNIIFTNEIRGEHLTQIIKSAGMLAVPSESQDLGLPINVLEAMAEGVPVLASNNSVYQELLGDNRGLLFESGKLDSLCEKLAYALSAPDSLTGMAQKAQTHIAVEHNWDRVTYCNLSLYLRVTETLHSQSVQQNI